MAFFGRARTERAEHLLQKGGEPRPGVLIVSDRQYHDTQRALFVPGGGEAQCCASGGEARRALCEGDFSLIVVNAPLPDEYGRELATTAAEGGADAVLICPAPMADKLAAGLEREGSGVFVLAKPLSRQQAAFALRIIRAGRRRVQKLTEQNRRLSKRLEDSRVLTQAKCALALRYGMTEEEAHRFLEKRAMDGRVSAREAALEIIRRCESPAE